MPRSIRFADAFGAVAGLLAAFLWLVSVAAVDPVRGVTDQELLTWWSNDGNRNGYIVSMYTLLAVCPFFLYFVWRLRARLKIVGSDDWADLFFASGIVATGALGVCAITRGVVASAMRFENEPLPGVDTLRFSTNLTFATWDLVILFVAALVAVASLLAITTRALPRWIGVLGALVVISCVVLLASNRAPFASTMIWLWMLATSLQLLRSNAEVSIPGPTWTSKVTGAPAETRAAS